MLCDMPGNACNFPPVEFQRLQAYTGVTLRTRGGSTASGLMNQGHPEALRTKPIVTRSRIYKCPLQARTFRHIVVQCPLPETQIITFISLMRRPRSARLNHLLPSPKINSYKDSWSLNRNKARPSLPSTVLPASGPKPQATEWYRPRQLLEGPSWAQKATVTAIRTCLLFCSCQVQPHGTTWCPAQDLAHRRS